ncbi:hypothetical protein CC86DRAFT_378606 [Ophiobolus disseminans]|uniref:Uncharacterized protein n=1 Tax=Ophiobolus disseminans TaxID=1469910 RepID=A0A6A7AAF9_9PLEO|nr:hypothetical protein CC86DRAFT_378606 [Ophiobolus disseminans]
MPRTRQEEKTLPGEMMTKSLGAHGNPTKTHVSVVSQKAHPTEHKCLAAYEVHISESSEYESESSLEEDNLSEQISRPIPRAKPAGSVPTKPRFLPSAEFIKKWHAAQTSEEKIRSVLSRFESPTEEDIKVALAKWEHVKRLQNPTLKDFIDDTRDRKAEYEQDPDEYNTQVMFYFQRHRERCADAKIRSRAGVVQYISLDEDAENDLVPDTRSALTPGSDSNVRRHLSSIHRVAGQQKLASSKLLPVRNNPARRPGDTLTDPMIIDSSDDEEVSSSDGERDDDVGAPTVTGSKRKLSVLKPSNKTSQEGLDKFSPTPTARKTNNNVANTVPVIGHRTPENDNLSQEQLLTLRTKTLAEFIPQDRLQGSRLLSAVQKASTTNHGRTSKLVESTQTSAMARDLFFGSISREAREEESRTGVHPFNRPLEDMQKMADASAMRQENGMDREIRDLHIRFRLSEVTSSATDPISQAQVALANAEIELTAARVDAKIATHKHRITLLDNNEDEFLYGNRKPTAEQERKHPYVVECEQEWSAAENAVHALRIKVHQAKNALGGLGIRVDMADDEVDLDSFANGPPPKLREGEWEAFWNIMECDYSDSDDEDVDGPPNKKQKVTQ